MQPPSTITVTFNDPVYLPSLTAGELEVNGVPAIGVMDVNGNTVTWTVDPSSYATGIDLPNVVTIGADAMGNQIMDISGQTLTPYSYTFFTTNVAPYIVSSSIDGQVFSPAPADVTEVVTFSQPMDTSFTTASSFELFGNYRNVFYAAASFSWDPTGTILTINYDNLPDDTYTLTLFASGFQNVVGIPLASDYVANFAVALGTAAFTTPFTPVPPLGDLIYTSTDDPVLVTPTDVDYLTLNLNAGETLTLIGTPTTSSLQLAITVFDPSFTQIGAWNGSRPRRRYLHRERSDRDDRHLHDRDQRCQRQHGPLLGPGLSQQLRQARHVERHDPDGSGPDPTLLLARPRQRRSAGGRGQPANRRAPRG